jgi:preprotein translocase subunit SecE
MKALLEGLHFGCVAQLVEQRSPKSPVGGSNPSALECSKLNGSGPRPSTPKENEMSTVVGEKKKVSYLREVQNELKKVTWTSKEELLFCTKAVIIATFLFGLAIYAVDLGVRGVLDTAANIVRMIFG